MDSKNKFNVQWISTGENNLTGYQTKQLDVLERELADIKDSLEVIEEKRRRLANLAKLYS